MRFVSFVVNFLSYLVAALPRWVSVVNNPSQEIQTNLFVKYPKQESESETSTITNHEHD